MAVSGGQGASQQIQAAPDAVDDGSSLSINERVKGFDIGEAIELFAGLRIGVYRDGVGLLLSPSGDSFNKDWDLGYGPIDCSLSV